MTERQRATPWQQEWRRMQLWLLAGYLTLVAAAALAFAVAQLGAPNAAIVIGVLGGLVDLVLIGRGAWSYIRVRQLRAEDSSSPKPFV